MTKVPNRSSQPKAGEISTALRSRATKGLTGRETSVATLRSVPKVHAIYKKILKFLSAVHQVLALNSQ